MGKVNFTNCELIMIALFDLKLQNCESYFAQWKSVDLERIARRISRFIS